MPETHVVSYEVAPLSLEQAVSVAAKYADAVDREARFPREAMEALKAAGLLGSMVPEALGGGGLSLSAIASQCQKLAEACASTAMIYAMHQIQVACVVNHAMGSEWHRDLARRIVRDQLLLASITSEVGTGGDVRSSVCAVAVKDGRFTLEKQGTVVSYGEQADVFLVTARSHADAPPSEQSLVVCLRDGSNWDVTGGWDALGMRGTCSVGFAFRGEGAAEQVIPAPYADISADSMVPVSHLLWSALWTGIAAGALTRARAYLRAQARRHPGAHLPGLTRLVHAVGLLEMAQARIASMLKSFDGCNALGSDRAVMTPQQSGWPGGIARGTALNTLKRDVSEMCHEVVMESMRICGIAGYKNEGEYSLGRPLRDILSAQLMISNDRIVANTGVLLLAQSSPLGKL